ncbi:MAG: hypothetical protein HYZ28_18555 [Myxococcales bacterium]|nr:hypothetical protein [Myxococcales bacterium]
MRALSFAVAFGLAAPALAAGDEEPKRVAETYLNALTGAGDERGKELLLGGVPMDAQLLTLENWRLASKDPVMREEGDLALAAQRIGELDKSGRKALTQMMSAEQVGDDLTMTEVSKEEAVKLMAPTRDKAAELVKANPVLAYVARVGKEVYWHPKNPMRAVLAKAGKSGRYSVEVHRWIIESREGPRQSARKWPLRVLRFKAGKVDTGWKVLPASDWAVD